MACSLLTGKKLLSSLLVMALTTLTLKRSSADGLPVALSGCPDKCGNVSIPYPFGTQDGCFREPFRVYCEDDNQAVYLQQGKRLKVLDFTLAQGEVLIQKRIATSCGNEITGKTPGVPWEVQDGGLVADYPYLTISSDKNQFTAVGCGITAIIKGQGENQPPYTIGCQSFCSSIIEEDNSTQCDGNMGCCQASIPGNLKSFQPSFIAITSVNYNDSGIPCIYAFVVEQNWFKFKTSYAKSMELYSRYRNKGTGVPLVLDLVVGNKTCAEAKSNMSLYACKAMHHSCIDRPSRSGYLCNCSLGYQGNPYLQGGCQDINECDHPSLYSCKGHCRNTIGSYTCSCPSGTQSKDPKIIPCTPTIGLSIGIGVGSAVGFICIVLVAMFLTRRIKHRREIKLRQKFFTLNRGQLLKQLVSQRTDIAERMIITLDEHEKATNNFDKARELGGGGHGTVYKGILSDLHVVAIKK